VNNRVLISLSGQKQKKMNEDSDEDMIDELEDILNGNKSKKKNRKKASSTENSLKVVWHKKTPSAF
jgi:hypothetical protein